jgi:hypothetical protein
VDSSLSLLVRSMRTALGPADDEVFQEEPHAEPARPALTDPSAPSAGIVRIPTMTRNNRSTSESTPAGVAAVPRRLQSAELTAGHDAPADTNNPMLSGVFRKTRNRTIDTARGDSRRNETPVLSILAPGDPLHWDAFNEPVADAEVDEFLSASGADPAQSSEGAVAEAPTPFAPDAYNEWSEKNGREES